MSGTKLAYGTTSATGRYDLKRLRYYALLLHMEQVWPYALSGTDIQYAPTLFAISSTNARYGPTHTPGSAARVREVPRILCEDPTSVFKSAASSGDLGALEMKVLRMRSGESEPPLCPYARPTPCPVLT
eukprot:766801-Rhodomonas_salina.4